MDEGDAEDAEIRDEIEIVNGARKGVSALDADESAELSFGARRSIFAQRPDNADVGMGAEDRVKPGVVLDEVSAALPCRKKGVGADDPRRAGDPGLNDARNVALMKEGTAEGPIPCRRCRS